MTSSPISATDPRFLQVLEELARATLRQSILIETTQVDSLPPTASKFGGTPYLPRDAEVPYKWDQQLGLLAQFRLADLPANDFLPDAGMLQFWIGREDCFPSEDLKDGDFAVVHYPQIDESLTESEVLERYEPDGGNMMPFSSDKPLALTFTMTDQPISVLDGGFDEAFTAVYNRAFPEAPIKEYGDLSEDLASAVFNRFYSTDHRLGGYPFFTQDDPRGYRGLEMEDVLLLQVDTDDYLMWGDVGVAGFFINPQELAAGDFSRVAFTWDCC